MDDEPTLPQSNVKRPALTVIDGKASTWARAAGNEFAYTHYRDLLLAREGEATARPFLNRMDRLGISMRGQVARIRKRIGPGADDLMNEILDRAYRELCTDRPDPENDD